MPATKQLDGNRDTSNFSPVKGGVYRNSALLADSTFGFWWGSEMYNGASRHYLRYDGSSLHTSNYIRYDGLYIRCVSEEKTVTDLTYLQDMTGEIANNTLDGATANLPPTISSPTALAGKNAMVHGTLLVKKVGVLDTKIVVFIAARSRVVETYLPIGIIMHLLLLELS